MSDQSQGDGWWIASDGKWYPPQTATPPAPPPPPGEPGAGLGARAWSRYRGWPKWAQIAAPVTAAILVLGARGGGGDEDSPAKTTTTEAAAFADIDDAVEAADVDVDGVNDADVEGIIEDICASSDADELAESVADLEVEDSGDVREVVEGAGDGAEVYCPDVVADDPQLISDSFAATMSLLAAQQPPPTQPPTTAPPTTPPPTTAPPPPPTTAPPPPPPPVTQAPSGVYYENCTAARNAGAAPVRRGDPGYGSHLDRDGDGIGCEN